MLPTHDASNDAVSYTLLRQVAGRRVLERTSRTEEGAACIQQYMNDVFHEEHDRGITCHIIFAITCDEQVQMMKSWLLESSARASL